MIRTFDDYEALSHAAVEYIIEAGRQALAANRNFDLVLAGGSTPQRAHALLAQALQRDPAPLASTHVYFGDERCVPPDHKDSNYRAAKIHLLDAIDIAPDHVHRIEAEDPDPRAAAERYAASFPTTPELIVLGMGADGHTASLFPGTAALTERTARFVVTEALTPPKRRISATPATLKAARQILVLIWGKNKAPALRCVFADEGTTRQTPARLLRDATWFVDAQAAKAARLA